MSSPSQKLTLLILSVTLTVTTSHNITQLLSQFPEYSNFNSLLTQTKLANEINSRQTITVLALSNSAISSLTSKNLPLSAIKNALSLHILLDYYDPSKLHQLANGTTLSTSLYQTTGNAKGNLGFVNITDLNGGKVAFGSAAPGSKLDSVYSKTVKQVPYNISVVEISSVILAPGVLNATVMAPSPAPVMVPGPAPGPAPVMGPAPAPVSADAPLGPSPMAGSPADSTMMTPNGAPGPSPSPGAEADKSTSGSGDVKGNMFEVVLSVVAASSVVFSMLS